VAYEPPPAYYAPSVSFGLTVHRTAYRNTRE